MQNQGVGHLLGLSNRISLGSEVSSGSSAGREESSEDWLDDRSEDDLSAVGDWKSHPENKDELEDVVECCDVSAIVYAFRKYTYGTSIRR